tara:strand:+ start:500 stop:700 length:201 start_codon:yes stop_codon:yes gene_type:complete
MEYIPNDYETTKFRIIKRSFILLVRMYGYNKAVEHANDLYGKQWQLYKNEVMQWYDFEILGVKYER